MVSAAEPRSTDPSAQREVSDARVRLAWEATPDDEVATFARVSRHRRRAAAAIMGVALAAVVRAGVPAGAYGQAVAASSAVIIAALIAHVLWLRPRQVVRARRAAGEPAPAHRLEAGLDGLRHTVGTWRTTYAWSAVRRVIVGRRHVFLHFSSTQVLTVPRRAFGPERDERRALEALRAWRRQGGGPVEAPQVEAERSTFALRYVLRPHDFAAFVQALQRRDLRVRPGGALAGVVLLVALLVAGPVSEGGFDAASLALAGVFAAVFGLLGLAPWWMPRLLTPLLVRAALRLEPARLPVGDVDLRVGPAGGWSSSSRGVSRFDWADVTDVLEGDGVVVLLFGPLTGVVVPDRALGDRRDAFVARCRAWLGAPVEAPEARPPRRPPGPPPDPFAPPSHGL